MVLDDDPPMIFREVLDVNCLCANGIDNTTTDNGTIRLGWRSGRTRLLYILCIHSRGCAFGDLEFDPLSVLAQVTH